MSKKHHRKQVARGRQSRHDTKFERRAARNRTIILIMAILMGLSLVAVPLGLALTSGSDASDASGEDDADAAADAADADADAADADADAADADADAADADEPDAVDEGGDAQAGAEPCDPPGDDVPEVDSEMYEDAPELVIDEDAAYVATLETTCGDVVIDLEAQAAPVAVNNLVTLAEDGYYDGVAFHRVIPGFVAQVGDPAGTGCGREDCGPGAADEPAYPGYTFEDELGLAEERYAEGPGGYPRGTVAMANAGPDTNGSQFFIGQGDPTGLPGPDYTVFGSVAEGMDVVDRIAATAPEGSDRPDPEVHILRVTIDQR